MLSRKHYKAVAASFANNKPVISIHTMDEYGPRYETWRIVTEDLASVFAADNPAFDRAKFLRACGVDKRYV